VAAILLVAGPVALAGSIQLGHQESPSRPTSAVEMDKSPFLGSLAKTLDIAAQIMLLNMYVQWLYSKYRRHVHFSHVLKPHSTTRVKPLIDF
jgi:hypothetical protein